ATGCWIAAPPHRGAIRACCVPPIAESGRCRACLLWLGRSSASCSRKAHAVLDRHSRRGPRHREAWCGASRASPSPKFLRNFGLALAAEPQFDREAQRALARCDIAAGGGGLAVGVHATQ